MYICNCNGITEKQVKAAVRKGVRHWHDVHTHYGFVPQCGKCQCDIVQYMSEHGADGSEEATPLFATSALAT